MRCFSTSFSLLLVRLGLVMSLAAGALPGQGAGFTPGNLVVLRMGDGAATLGNTGTAIFLEEYTPTGTLVQTVALPTTTSGAVRRIVNSGTATSNGALLLSANGQYLTLAGYDAAVGAAGVAGTTSTSTPRVVAQLDATGSTSTPSVLTDAFSGDNFRAAITVDGTGYWTEGNASASTSAGTRYAAASATAGTSTQVSSTTTNNRVVGIFNNQLYYTTGSGTARGLYAVGNGLPTAAATTATPVIATGSSGSAYGFVLFDESSSEAGLDVAYIADDAAGLQKYCKVSGVWTLKGTIGTAAAALRGLTGSWDGSTATLYVTGDNGSVSNFYKVTDTGGYNVAPSATTLPTALISYTATTAKKVLRGVAFAPVAAPTISSVSTSSGVAGSSVVITGTNFYNGNAALRLSFNSAETTDFTIDNPTQITATVPAGATAGRIAVITQGGTATSATDFTPLPVELTRFGAERELQGVRLSWATASEKNSAYFEVQRRRAGAGAEFEAVAAVPAAGNTNTPRTYTALDKGLSDGTVYYRLRQLDRDGSAHYSGVVAVSAGGILLPVRLEIYPNPATDVVTINNATLSGQPVSIRDLTGRALRTATVTVTGEISLQGLAAGTYLLQVRDGNSLITRRITKQ